MRTTREYLDWNATAPIRPEALDAMVAAMRGNWGNASSLHEEGRRAASALEEARSVLSDWTGSRASEWILTSGGTESIHSAILGRVAAGGGARRIVSSRGEHACTRGILQDLREKGWEVVEVPLRADGTWDPEAVLRACSDGETALATLIWANNETGAISDAQAVAEGLRRIRVPLHLDAVQCFGRIPVDLGSVPASLVSLSGHKFGAPKGVGALFVRRGTPWRRWMQGGGQERSRRGGTVNVPGAAAMAAAAAAARRDDWCGVSAAKRRMEERILSGIHGARILSSEARRLPNTTCAILPGTDSSTLLSRLDARGFAVSSGSACSTGDPEPSPVLLSMGLAPEDAHAALRISLGPPTEADALERFVGVLGEEVREIRKLSDFRS